jgi:molybdopterin converting factor small subunit
LELETQSAAEYRVARIKLRIIGLPEKADSAKESVIDASNTQEIIRSIETKYPEGTYTLKVIVNGVGVEAESMDLNDGDEVVIIPIMSGG